MGGSNGGWRARTSMRHRYADTPHRTLNVALFRVFTFPRVIDFRVKNRKIINKKHVAAHVDGVSIYT